MGAGALRLCLITDGRGDAVRVERIVAAALAGGATCVQLREPGWTARQLLASCERLRPLCDRHGALLLVNDRLDVAATGVPHGAQIGHRSLPPALARRMLPAPALLGLSAHDASELELAAATNCDFALLSPIWPTSSKPGAPSLGPTRAAALTRAARLPVVWLGGIGSAQLPQLRSIADGRPIGIAVRSAICDAADPRAAAEALVF
jgi:thiamine-phosphate pyrophosphorylase